MVSRTVCVVTAGLVLSLGLQGTARGAEVAQPDDLAFSAADVDLAAAVANDDLLGSGDGLLAWDAAAEVEKAGCEEGGLPDISDAGNVEHAGVLEEPETVPAGCDEPLVPAGAPDLDVEAAEDDAPASAEGDALGRLSWTVAFGPSAARTCVGQPVTLAVVAEGPGAEALCYNFVWNYEGRWDRWDSVVKSTGSHTDAASWTFTPTRPGTYRLFCDVVDAQGNVTTYSSSVEVELGWSASLSVPEAAVPLGSAVNLGAVPNGDGDGREYRYNFVWSYEGRWSDGWDSVVKSTGGYTADPQWSFVPSKAGRYRVFCDVVDRWGNVRTFDSWVKVVEVPWTARFDVPAAGTVGEPVDLEAFVASDQTEGYSYNFVWNYEGLWGDGWDSVVKSTGSMAAQSAWSFTPTKPGLYQVYCDVRGPSGETRTYSAATNVGLGWSAALEVPASPVPLGSAVGLSAAVQGVQDTSGLRYNFVWNRDGRWDAWDSVVRSTGEHTVSDSWSFVPAASGRYQLFGDVVDRWGNVVTVDSWVEVSQESVVEAVRRRRCGRNPRGECGRLVPGRAAGVSLLVAPCQRRCERDRGRLDGGVFCELGDLCVGRSRTRGGVPLWRRRTGREDHAGACRARAVVVRWR